MGKARAGGTTDGYITRCDIGEVIDESWVSSFHISRRELSGAERDAAKEMITLMEELAHMSGVKVKKAGAK